MTPQLFKILETRFALNLRLNDKDSVDWAEIRIAHGRISS